MSDSLGADARAYFARDPRCGLERRQVRAAGGQARLIKRVRDAKHGDTSAFEELVLEYGPTLYRFVLSLVRDEEGARDVFQETLLVAWRDLQRLRRPESFWSWLCGIALRKARTASRRKTPTVSDAVIEARELAPGGASELRWALDSLAKKDREVLLMRYLLGLSEGETARILGVRVGTVKSRTARARDHLAASLSRVPRDG